MTPEGIDALLLDRLVEGELSGPERRVALRGLDSAPDGWKRLAVAFLEAQAWRQALADGVAAPLPPNDVPSPRFGGRARVGGRPSQPAHWGRVFAVAAGVFLAFAAGWFGRPTDRPAAAAVAEAAVEIGPSRRIGEIVWNGEGALATVGVPAQRISVYENPDAAGLWLASAPEMVPSYAAGRLERMGCGVVSHRDVVPVALADGRMLAVLVEDARLRLKGRLPNL